MSRKPPTAKELMSQLPQAPIHKNPKYAGVQAKIDSGATVDKFYAKHSQAALNSHGIRNVTAGFKRIRLSTLRKWIETAMIVLSEPDYIETGESIYDIANVPHPSERAFSEVSSTVSMAGTEAQVCMEEPGVPPMYAFGPDIVDQNEAADVARIANAKIENVTYGGQNADLYNKNQTTQLSEAAHGAGRANAVKNKTSQFDFTQDVEVNTSLKYVQQLTTRDRQQKLVQRIHLKTGYQLEIFKGQNVDATKSVPVPCRTKQFVVVDMRSDVADFVARHLWGSVHLPLSLLHRAGARMPGPLHYFAKFEESIFVVVGILGAELEQALKHLVDYGVNPKNIVPLMQEFGAAEEEHPNLFVRQ